MLILFSLEKLVLISLLLLESTFGISAPESITEARIQGVPIVSIAAIIQHNTSGFASPKEKKYYFTKGFRK